MTLDLRTVWRRVPAPLRQLAARTGVPYVVSYLARYARAHRLANFAGNLELLKAAYRAGDAGARADLDQRFAAIVDGLVMPNGVKKTTYAERQARTLRAVLAAVSLPHPEVRVLDIPASTGIASLESYALLRERYRVAEYVLGDLYHSVYYDPHRGCVFDEQRNLLQVASRRRFFSVYRGFASGNWYSPLSACLLFPHSVRAWYLRRRHRFAPGNGNRRLLVVHPEVERLVADGVFRLANMDVFRPIDGQYHLILSFNLLQRNYFPAETIAAGERHLATALAEGGVLVLGNTESYRAFQKQDGLLIPRLQEGTF